MESDELVEKWNKRIEENLKLIQSDWFKEEIRKFVNQFSDCKGRTCPLWRDGRGCMSDRCALDMEISEHEF